MSRITERKLKDKRFRKTEEAIIMALFTATEAMSPERLIKTAGISRATFYRHHGSVTNIVPNYEQYVLQKYKHTTERRPCACGGRIRLIYHYALIFFCTHKKIVQFLIERGSCNSIEKIILTLEPEITASGKVSPGEMFKIYAKETSVVIEEWGRDGFSGEEIGTVLSKIMYLTDSAKERLGPLAGFSSTKS